MNRQSDQVLACYHKNDKILSEFCLTCFQGFFEKIQFQFFLVFCRFLFCGHLQDLELLMPISHMGGIERKSKQSKSYFFGFELFLMPTHIGGPMTGENVAYFPFQGHQEPKVWF